jgi:L-alanine-DL-glutamate epimerase-like enolase superfamily enzyme
MKRKQFLRNTLAATFAATFLPEGRGGAPVTLPAAPMAGAGQAKITAVKAFALPKATYVKIETDTGMSGWGEGDHENPVIVAQVVEKLCAPLLIGGSPWDSEYYWQQLFFKLEDVGSTGLLPGALAGIDNALWDLKGKLAGMPVYQLLGGMRTERVRLYGSFPRGKPEGGWRTPDEMAAVAAGFVAEGYGAVKARMQIRALNVDPDPDPTYAVIKAVRKAIGDDISLFVDFNNGYTPARAIALAKKLYEHFNIAIVEEPVTYLNYHDLAQVVEALDIPVAAGEHEFNRWQIRELILTGKADIINTDVMKAGGITENRRMAALAQAFDRPVMAHNTRPTLATAATLHFLASIPNAARWQEFGGFRVQELGVGGLFENSLEFDKGYLKVPQIPGIGLIANEQKIIAQSIK